MSTSELLAALMILAASGSAQAADACRQQISPGHSIGRVRLGMSVNDLRGVGTVKPLSEKSLALQLEDGTQLKAELDAKLKIERVWLEASQVCLIAGTLRRIDLKAPGAETVAPLPDCGLSGTVQRSSWLCPETGIEFFREGETSGASVFRAKPIKPFVTAPPQRPELPKPSVQCEAVEGGQKKCVEVPAPDPCAGNVAPMPEMACGFFGRNEQLAVHCYLTHLCMGVFDSAAGRVEVRGEDGALLGTMQPWHEGRTLRYAFGTAPRVGTKVRIVVNAALAAVPPKSSLPNLAVSPDEAQSPVSVGGSVAVKLRHLVGARVLPGGYALDLKVPRSAISKASTGQKAAE